MSQRNPLDAIIIGAGFAGMQLLHRLRGAGFRVRVLEAAADVGGTWYHNCYPGARCDVESLQYAYQFSEELQQEWEWTERFATQPEILNYANHVADRFDLRRDIDFKRRVSSAHYDEASCYWTVATEDGQVVQAHHCIMATGCLSSASTPDIPGLEDFRGELYHTGQWPKDNVDFAGRRVAVIGTGSSGIQVIPELAKQAQHLTVFQRTACYSVPARNAPLTAQAIGTVKAKYAAFREANKAEWGGVSYPRGISKVSALEVSNDQREEEFNIRWEIGGVGFLSAFSDLMFSPEANEYASEFVRNKIRSIVHDPETAATLCPDFPVGCKRICLDTDYYATFNRDNVSLVSLREQPIGRITRRGLVIGDRVFDFDDIVFATGFDAITGALLNMDIRGRGGLTLREKWASGPSNYLGLATSGFPNLFLVTGPGSPSVLTNMLVSIDQHVSWIGDCLEYIRAQQINSIEADAEAEIAWMEQVDAIVKYTLFSGCNSWYTGANLDGKPKGFMPYAGGLPMYTQLCNEVAQNNYRGFSLN